MAERSKLPDVIPPIQPNLGPGGSSGVNLRTLLRDQYNIECSVAYFKGM